MQIDNREFSNVNILIDDTVHCLIRMIEDSVQSKNLL